MSTENTTIFMEIVLPHMAVTVYVPGVVVESMAVAGFWSEAVAPLQSGFPEGQIPDGVGAAVSVTKPLLYPTGMTSVSLVPGVSVVEVTFSQETDATFTRRNGCDSLPPRWL